MLQIDVDETRQLPTQVVQKRHTALATHSRFTCKANFSPLIAIMQTGIGKVAALHQVLLIRTIAPHKGMIVMNIKSREAEMDLAKLEIHTSTRHLLLRVVFAFTVQQQTMIARCIDRFQTVALQTSVQFTERCKQGELCRPEIQFHGTTSQVSILIGTGMGKYSWRMSVARR